MVSAIPLVGSIKPLLKLIPVVTDDYCRSLASRDGTGRDVYASVVPVVKPVSMLCYFFSYSAPAKLNSSQWYTWSSMKALGSRFSFSAGFAVGILTLYLFLRQVWFERSVTPQHGSFDELHDHQRQLEEEEKIWKKERSALFNLQHPHHTGTPFGSFEYTLCLYTFGVKRKWLDTVHWT